MGLYVFFWKDLFNYTMVFGIATIREKKQGVIKNSYLIAAVLVLWLLKETQTVESTHTTWRSCGEKERQNGSPTFLTDFREHCVL